MKVFFLVLNRTNFARRVLFASRSNSFATEKSNDADIFASNSQNTETDAKFDLIANIPEAEEALEKEEKFKKYVEIIRNVSRFSRKTAELKYNKQIPTYSDSEANYLKNPKYFQTVLAKYGKSSGVQPGVAWPHKAELLELINDEKEFDLTLEKKINILVKRKQDELEKLEKMEKDTDDALKKMPKQVDAYFERLSRNRKKEEEKLAKKQTILDQAREFYGFEVDMRDQRIKEMVEKLDIQRKEADRFKKKELEKKNKAANVLEQKFKAIGQSDEPKPPIEKKEALENTKPIEKKSKKEKKNEKTSSPLNPPTPSTNSEN